MNKKILAAVAITALVVVIAIASSIVVPDVALYPKVPYPDPPVGPIYY